MLVLSLLGCGMGTLDTLEGDEPLRAALYFVPDSTISLALLDSRQIYVLLANSTILCEPEVTEDDPTTANLDEAGAANEYWEAQFGTALIREGAIVVVMALAVAPEEDWLGEYDFESDAWDIDALQGYVARDGRVAAGGWSQIEESTGDAAEGVISSELTVAEEDHDYTVGGSASVEITRRDTVLAGRFDFKPTHLTGQFEAARCDNPEFLSRLYQILEATVLTENLD